MSINFPDIIPNTMSFGIKYSTQINISPLSGSVQTIEVPGARWVASMTYSGMSVAEGRELAGFIADLRGSGGRFFLYDFSHPEPRGSNSFPSAVTLNGNYGVGVTSIATIGWTASAAGVLLVGDYIELPNKELKIVTSIVNALPGGDALIEFEPPLRNGVATSDPVNTSQCRTTMLLDNDEYRWQANNAGLLTDSTITCMEGF